MALLECVNRYGMQAATCVIGLVQHAKNAAAEWLSSIAGFSSTHEPNTIGSTADDSTAMCWDGITAAILHP
jgi:hypothetical protein